MSRSVFFQDTNFQEIVHVFKVFGNENHFLTLSMDFEENNYVFFAIHTARKLYCSFS